MTRNEIYYKEGKHITTISMYGEGGREINFIYYKNGNDEMALDVSNKNGEKIVKDTIFYGDIGKPTVGPGYYATGGFFKTLYVAMFGQIYDEEVNGVDCYLIKDRYGDYYIEKATGLMTKVVHVESSEMIDLFCEFDTVQDSDIVKPDMTAST